MKKRAVGTTVKVLHKYVGGSTVEEFLVLSKWTTHRSLFFMGQLIELRKWVYRPGGKVGFGRSKGNGAGSGCFIESGSESFRAKHSGKGGLFD